MADADYTPPTFTGRSLGTMPGAKKGFPGRPIMEHEGKGGYSTHLNMVTNIGGQEYIVPTMFGGQVVSEDEAIKRVHGAGMIDPDTGHPLVGYKTPVLALAAERAQHQLLIEQARYGMQMQQLQDLIPH